MSDHAKLRWLQYTGEPDADLSHEWEAAIQLWDHGLHGDEARYVVGHDVVLVRRGSAVATVIDNDDALRREAQAAIGEVLRRIG